MRRCPLQLEALEDRTVPSTSQQFVQSLYTNFLQRTPSDVETAGFVKLLVSGTSQAAVARMFVTSPEFINIQTSQDYTNLLGRSASNAELQGWLSARLGGLSDRQEVVDFLSSSEYFTNHNSTAQDWLTAVYHDVLGRTVDASGEAAFLSLSGQASGRARVASTIVFSPEGTADAVNQAYQLALGRPADPQGLSFWTGQVMGGVTIPQVLADLAASAEYAATREASGTPTTSGTSLITLTLPPLDINLLGLEVKTTDTIQVTVSAQPGQGALLGNLLTDVSNLINLQGVNNALNNVLGNVVTLVNAASLSVSGVNTASGPLSTAPAATTPVLDLFVAPVHLNLLGAVVDTTPIHLTITATSGNGLVLGNVVADLANLFNPPLPSTLDINTINAKLTDLLNQLNTQIPGIGAATVTTPPIVSGSDQILSLTVPPINLNLLGLNLQTSQIQVNANANTGNGNLLGNVLTTLLNTLGATPQNLTDLSTNLNALLAKVVGVLNATSLVLPAGAVSSLTQVLQTLALPNLVNATGTASAPILNLSIASSDGTTPPVNVDLLGLQITTSNIQAQLIAQTGDGQVLGNLLYNVANLLNPGGALSLLTILNQLGL